MVRWSLKFFAKFAWIKNFFYPCVHFFGKGNFPDHITHFMTLYSYSQGINGFHFCEIYLLSFHLSPNMLLLPVWCNIYHCIYFFFMQAFFRNYGAACPFDPELYNETLRNKLSSKALTFWYFLVLWVIVIKMVAHLSKLVE